MKAVLRGWVLRVSGTYEHYCNECSGEFEV